MQEAHLPVCGDCTKGASGTARNALAAVLALFS